MNDALTTLISEARWFGGKGRDWSLAGVRRVGEVDAIVRQAATPWFERYGLSADDLAAIRPAEGWLFRYAPQAHAAPGTSAHAVRPGETY